MFYRSQPIYPSFPHFNSALHSSHLNRYYNPPKNETHYYKHRVIWSFAESIFIAEDKLDWCGELIIFIVLPKGWEKSFTRIRAFYFFICRFVELRHKIMNGVGTDVVGNAILKSFFLRYCLTQEIPFLSLKELLNKTKGYTFSSIGVGRDSKFT